MGGRYIIAAALVLVCVGAWSQESEAERTDPIIIVVQDDDAVLIIGDDPEEEKLPDIVFRKSSEYIGEDEDFIIEWGGPAGARRVTSVTRGILRGRAAPEPGTVAALAARGGIGPAYVTNIFGGPASVAMLTFKMPRRPVVFGASAEFGYAGVNGAVTVDWRVLQTVLGSALGLHVGPRFSFSAPEPFWVGLLAPVGISWYPRSVVETFLDVGPGAVYWWNEYGSGVAFRLQVTAGVRYLFPR